MTLTCIVDSVSPLDVAGSGGGLTCYPGVHSDPNESAGARGMIRLLRERGAKLTARSAVILGDEASLRKISAEEDVITPRDDRGWLLRLAVDCNRPGVLQLLLDLGLDPNSRVRVEDGDLPTFTWGMPLYQCARYGKHAMAETLLVRGADPNGQVYASGTPLSEAYGQRDEGDDRATGAPRRQIQRFHGRYVQESRSRTASPGRVWRRKIAR